MRHIRAISGQRPAPAQFVQAILEIVGLLQAIIAIPGNVAQQGSTIIGFLEDASRAFGFDLPQKQLPRA